MQKPILGAIRTYFRLGSRLMPGLVGRQALAVFGMPLGQPGVNESQRAVLARAQASFVESMSRRVRVYRWQARDARLGRTVLLVHGWASRAARMVDWVDPLTAAGYDVVALDLPAHGESQGRSVNVTEMACAVRRVAEECGPIYAFMTHSFGALVSARALSQGDPRYGARVEVERLIMVGAPISLYELANRFGEWVGLSEKGLAAHNQRCREVVDHAWERYDVPSLLSDFDTPTLVIHDRGDKEQPVENCAFIGSRLRNARCLVTDGLGHRRILQDPAVIARCIAFLADAGADIGVAPGAAASQPGAAATPTERA